MNKHGFCLGLAFCFLVCSGLALACELDRSVDVNQTVSPIFLVSNAVDLPGVSDPMKCWASCCDRADCDLAWMSFPEDGAPECKLVHGCPKGGCLLLPSKWANVYVKVSVQTRTEVEDGEGGPHVVPMMAAGELQTTESSDVHCRQPMKVGPCRAAFPRFYYNVTNQSCSSFIYGGCGGNGNNFVSQEECETNCTGVTGSVLPDDSSSVKTARRAPSFDPELSVHSPESEPAPTESAHAEKTDLPDDDDYAERCEVASEAGPCRAAFPRWYFNSKTGSCESFVYGGCKGNRNNYDSEESCNTACPGSFEKHGRTRWTAAFFLFVTLACISALLLVALVLVSVRRHRRSRPSSISDKEELLPDPDEQSSVESLPIPESPKSNQA
uniref:kunitz-type protease inhibitor 2 isoform X1 n=1 Tax=Monopterus albus TaxID=43700 RepID=UPI0009B3145F|nr:kunitz-type protease inhibitor 2-like isoform X1 [Monopterus albus]